MLSNFKRGTVGADIGWAGFACLSGITNNCRLAKPEWWSRYQDQPGWWTNVPVTLPKVTCFRDGFHYIPSGAKESEGARGLPKAWALLSEFTPITCTEKILTFRMGAVAYSEIGDHHRAIEWAWQVPEKFSGDTNSSVSTLKFIASEFEKLREPEHAQAIRRSIPCFLR